MKKVKARVGAMRTAKENETQSAKKIWIVLGVVVSSLMAMFAGLEISRAIQALEWTSGNDEDMMVIEDSDDGIVV